MAGNPKSTRPKHIPKRTCIACREIEGKRSLIRVVRTANGVEVDLTGKKNGRGAYIHPYQQCWQTVLEGKHLERALRIRIAAEDRRILQEYMNTLPSKECHGEENDLVAIR